MVARFQRSTLVPSAYLREWQYKPLEGKQLMVIVAAVLLAGSPSILLQHGGDLA